MATRIMVIDDEPLICQLLAYQLGGAGYEVIVVQNSQEALERIFLVQPHLILLDVMMPGISGWDLCREIRASSAVPVIMLTAKSADCDVVTGLHSGADDYIGKPFNMAQLLARIEAVLRRTRPNSPVGLRTHSNAERLHTPAPHPLRSAASQSTPYPLPPPENTPSLPRLGQRFNAERQRRGLSLHQAEHACGVRWDFLQALEQEQYRYLPRHQLRQALHAYGSFLGIDPRPFFARAAPNRRPVMMPVAVAATLMLVLAAMLVSMYLL